MTGPESDIKPGNCLKLANLPLGTVVHNIEMRPGKGGQLARSAGTSAQLIAREGKYATLRMPSGEMRMISIECKATVGQVGNIDHENISLGKAGRTRWSGKRPHVRGVAMNPVDHPMGGGEGRSFRGAPSLHSVGRSDQGISHAQGKTERQVHTSSPEIGVGSRPAVAHAKVQSVAEQQRYRRIKCLGL